jgi:ribosome biogenesis GTPase
MSQDTLTMKESLGWDEHFAERWERLPNDGSPPEARRFPARVVAEERDLYRIQEGPLDSRWAEVTGRLRYDAELFPAVGDWVVCTAEPGQDRASIHAVLPRRTCLRRREAGRSERAQVLAANVDIGFVVSSLNADLNPRRIERYLTTIWDGGARPVILLTKRDLCPDADDRVSEIASACPGVEVLPLSAITGEGLDVLAPFLAPGRTVVFLGSSGVGKSTLLNRLLGKEAARTLPIRESDERGRHATTSRHLWVLPAGTLVIDTPGMRELRLLADETSLDRAFEELGELARSCRFTDCGHRTEPGCAVRAALASGAISRERIASYDKLGRELAFQARKNDKAESKREKDRWKRIHCQAQAHMRRKRWEE